VTPDVTSGGTHHHHRHEWRSDTTFNGQLEDADHSPAFGLSPTDSQIRRASRANRGVQLSTWLTMVPHTNS
jgi:hypothetical protein